MAIKVTREEIVINKSRSQVVHEGMSVCRVITRLIDVPVQNP